MSASRIKAGAGYVELGTDDSKLVKGLDAAASRFKQFGSYVASIGAGIAAAGAAITAPFINGLSAFSAWGSEMTSTMRATGMEMLEMDELMDGLGNTMDGTSTSAESFIAAVAKMSEFMASARSGSAEANAALQAMGLSLSDLEGMTQSERMMAFADGLDRISDAGQRIALQRDVFGRGGLALNVQGGSAGIRARAARQDEVEGQLTEEDQQLAREYTQAMNEMKLAIAGVWKTLGAAAAGSARDWLKVLTEIIIVVRKFIEDNREMIGIIFNVGLALTAVGTSITILGGIFYAAGFAISFFSGLVSLTGTILGAILTPAIWLVSASMLAWKATMWLLNAAIVVTKITVTILTGGVYLLAIAVGVLATVALAALAAALVAPIAMFGMLLYQIASGVGAFTRIGNASEQAASQIADSFNEAFDSIVMSGTTAISVIQSAFRRGDWATVWETVKIMAQIAWLEVAGFAVEAFYSVLSVATGIWHDITDTLYDAFADTWTAIRILFERGTTAIKYVFLTMAADVIDSFGSVLGTIRQVLSAAAAVDPTGNAQRALDLIGNISSENLRQTARDINSGAGEAAIRAEAQLEARRRMLEREQRNIDRQQLEIQERDARQAGRAGEADALRRQLNQLRNQEIGIDLVNNLLGMGMALFSGDGQGGPGAGINQRFSSAGLAGFNAQLLFGALGGNRGETEGQRQIRLQQQAIERMDEQIRQLRDVARVAGARWG